MPTTELFIGVLLPIVVSLGITVTVLDVPPKGYLVARVCFWASALDVFVFDAYWVYQSGAISTPWFWVRVGWGLCVPFALIGALRWVRYREDLCTPRLRPAKQPTPPMPVTLPFALPDDALMVFLGSNVAWATRMPHTVLTMGSEVMFAFDRHAKRRELVVTILKIFDDRHDIIARIENGEFWITQSARRERPDRSTLVVFDHNDHEVLRVSFLNPNALALTCVFRHRAVPHPLILTLDEMRFGGMTIQRTVFGENAADISV